ncbi:NYN domain-containing protein [Marinitoga lauensis]|uniref:NYN domain-containing protein n=1 Tax=Marinitoga lauensis TaxID=2201189 RepID=UPI001404FBA3|nr:NYN domain-containing protein [Marinitoga lauensis]
MLKKLLVNIKRDGEIIKSIFIFMDYQNQPVDPELIIEKIKELGKIVGGKAYAHWSKYPATMFSFSRHGIELIEMPEDGFENKKGNDIKLAIDAIETMFSLPHIDGFVLVTGDADFVPLVKKLRIYGKEVIVVSRSKNTSKEMELSADIFIPYEEIVKSEKIEDKDTIEDIVDEIIRIIEEHQYEDVNENIIKRIVTGMKIDYRDFGFLSYNDFINHLIKEIRNEFYSKNGEYSEYEENYMRYIERLLATSVIPLKLEQLISKAQEKNPWITKNSKYSLKELIVKMIEEKRLWKNSKGYILVPIPRRWEIKHEKILPYPEFRDKFVEYVFKLFKEKKANSIIEAIHSAKKDLNLTNKVVGSFGIALKFSGKFIGKDGSDYVSMKTPVYLNADFNEFKIAVEAFYIKSILKDEDIHEKNLPIASKYIYNTENTNQLKDVLEYLMNLQEVFYVKPYYKYYKNLNK